VLERRETWTLRKYGGGIDPKDRKNQRTRFRKGRRKVKSAGGPEKRRILEKTG